MVSDISTQLFKYVVLQSLLMVNISFMKTQQKIKNDTTRYTSEFSFWVIIHVFFKS